MYHIEINSSIINWDRNNCDSRSIKQWFSDNGKVKPAPYKVLGWPFNSIYRIYGDCENGQFIAVKHRG